MAKIWMNYCAIRAANFAGVSRIYAMQVAIRWSRGYSL
jgi:hypothetical protein